MAEDLPSTCEGLGMRTTQNKAPSYGVQREGLKDQVGNVLEMLPLLCRLCEGKLN